MSPADNSASKQRMKDLQEIAVVIDDWDDIFSDFDPRPFNQRAVSEDFIAELRRRYQETRRGDFVITIYAPQELHDTQEERLVVQRLKKHFYHIALQKRKIIRQIRVRGFSFVGVGIIALGFLTTATYLQWFSALTIDVISIVLMPLGWFGIWEGFSKIVDISPVYGNDEKFYTKLAAARYRFTYLHDDE